MEGAEAGRARGDAMEKAPRVQRRLGALARHVLSQAPCGAAGPGGPSLPPAQPSLAGFCPTRLGRLDEFLERIVAQGLTPMGMVAVVRGGTLAHFATVGNRDEERQAALEPDTIFRIFSMTKAVVSMALLMLYEEGRFETFDEPVAKYIPCFKEMQVYVSGDSPDNLRTQPAKTAITIKHLLTHMGGVGYGWVRDVPVVSDMYNKHGVLFGPGTKYTLKEACDLISKLPLLSEPGTEWHYSHSTDIVGYLVEVLSGQRLSDFLESRIFGPLGMVDTGFSVPPEKAHRFAASYLFKPAKSEGQPHYVKLDDPQSSPYLRAPAGDSGGGGLVSTMHDYLRFAQFYLREGVTAEGVRIIGKKTLRWATLNHLPGGADLETVAAKCTLPRNVAYRCGQAFSAAGLARIVDPSRYDAVCSEGELAWGSVASGYMWLDPKEDIGVVFMTQLTPSGTYNWRRQLHGLVYQALLDPAKPE